MSEQQTDGEIEHIDFDDNRLVAALSGEHDAHLSILGDSLGVRIDPRGNRFAVTGGTSARMRTIAALTSLYAKLQRGENVTVGDVRAAAKLSEAPEVVTSVTPSVKTPQALFLRAPPIRRCICARWKVTI